MHCSIIGSYVNWSEFTTSTKTEHPVTCYSKMTYVYAACTVHWVSVELSICMIHNMVYSMWYLHSQYAGKGCSGVFAVSLY